MLAESAADGDETGRRLLALVKNLGLQGFFVLLPAAQLRLMTG